MTIGVDSQGTATFTVRRRTWISLVVFLVTCFFSHARLQYVKLDVLATSCRALDERVASHSERITEMREDFRATTQEFRQGMQAVNACLSQLQHLEGTEPIDKLDNTR